MDWTMLRIRSRRAPAPPLVTPSVNTRVAMLIDGARYGGRVDDVGDGGLVVAAPDVQLLSDRPVILEWRDSAGVWQMPAQVVASRSHPWPTTTLRPIGASECLGETQVGGPAELRATARIVESHRFPSGTRVPVTSVQLVGDRIAFWTILPVGVGDHVDLMLRTTDSDVLRAGLVVARFEARSGTWLGRADCDAAQPGSAVVARLVAALLADAQAPVAGH
jgi:hypothetical protein